MSLKEQQARLKAELTDALSNTSLKKARAKSYVDHITFREMTEKAQARWDKIPSYEQEKAKKPEHSPMDHFDAYWRESHDAGLVFQHQIRSRDPQFLLALNHQIKNHPDRAPREKYLVPTLKEMNSRLATMVHDMVGEDGVKAINTVRVRELQRSR